MPETVIFPALNSLLIVREIRILKVEEYLPLNVLGNDEPNLNDNSKNTEVAQ